MKTFVLAESWPLVWNFAQRDLRARYKRNLLGWGWSMINPLSVVLIYGLVFSVIFRVPPPPTRSGNGAYFSVYLFVGLIVWNHFTGMVNGSMGWLAGVSELRKKIYFPTETALFGGMIATTTQTMLEVAVLLSIQVLVSNFSWTIFLFPVIILLAGMFGLGIGFFVSIANTRYRDVAHLVGIVLNLGFYATPIVYTADYLEGKGKWGITGEMLINLNPVAHFVMSGHDVAYVGVLPEAQEWLIMLLLAVVPFVTGLVYFRRNSMSISEEL